MTRKIRLPFLLAVASTAIAWVAGPTAKAQQQTEEPDILFSTFSLVGYDPEAKEWGVVVTSVVPTLRDVVPWAKAGVGAVATQASTNKSFGPDGIAWLAKGKSPEEIAKIFKESDKKIDVRQFGIVDAKGNSFSFTGEKCGKWAGHKTGKNYACQGNILAGEAVVNDTAKTFEETKGSLAIRFMRALEAGQKAGGDSRQKPGKVQAAAMIIVHDNTNGKGGKEDYVVDLRIDKDADAVKALAKALDEHLKKKK
ncbi:MAG TPA: DUF1028 domain-containing protein [Gemmataceae bacterium]|nr:DUF1028 domain-containing protein [Gemmataceae bacterium]